MPLISIIIPVYNVENYLTTCLDSVVQQSLKDYEVIMVDDGSTDGSGRICDEYAHKLPEFHVVHQTNKGISAARNFGMKEAKGKYLLFLDSDDFLVPGTMQSLLNLAEDNNLEILGFSIINVSEECKSSPLEIGDMPKNLEIMNGFVYMANHQYTAQVWWYIVRRTLVIDNDIEFPVGHMLEDAAFNLRLFSNTQRMAQVQNVLYCYRIRSSSIMHNKNKEHQQKLMYDYLFAASDVGKALDAVCENMNEDCYNRCRSRRDSYVFFGAIRAFKIGVVDEYLKKARSQQLYPFKRMSKIDYPGLKITLIHWCISHSRLWRILSYLYLLKR